MYNLKALRSRIKSVKSTQKTTRAMNMVAAAKQKKLKKYIEENQNPLKIIENLIASFLLENDLENIPSDLRPFFSLSQESKDHNDDSSAIFIVLGSNRGMCGGFNSNLAKYVTNCASFNNNSKNQIITIGSKIYDQIKKQYEININLDSPESGSRDDVLRAVVSYIISQTKEGNVRNISVYYNNALSTISPVQTDTQILPIKTDDLIDDDAKANYYKFEGNVMPVALETYILLKLQEFYSISRFSEEKARMISMDSASKNAKDILDNLSLELNRKRQAIITNELIEIISGSNSI